MAHYAKVFNGTVISVIVAEEDAIKDMPVEDGVEWVQTSYNTFGGVHLDQHTKEPTGKVAIRKNYAQIGGTYDKENDAFIGIKPYPSWILNDKFQWQPPIPFPNDGNSYTWFEDEQEWVQMTE